MFTITMIVLGVLALIVCIATSLAMDWLDKKSKEPRFVFKKRGNKTAIAPKCEYLLSKADPKQLISRGIGNSPLVFVSKTVCYADPPRENDCGGIPFKKEYSREEPQDSFRCNEEAADLFVPFADETIIDFKEQIEHLDFVSYPEERFDSLAKQAMRDAVTSDRIGRMITDWRNYGPIFRRLSRVRILAVIVCMCCLITAGCYAVWHWLNSNIAYTYYATLTELGQNIPQTKVYTEKTSGPYTMWEEPGYDGDIITGTVTVLDPVGGDLFRIEIERSAKGRYRYGFAAASLHLRKGDKAYLRSGHLTSWKNGVTHNYILGEYWALTEQQALEHVKTGRFKIVE